MVIRDKKVFLINLLIQSIIYFLLLVFPNDAIFSYLALSSIIICFVVSLIWKRNIENRYLISIALLLTIFSDLLLLFFIEYRLIAMIIFSMVQLTYGFFLHLFDRKKIYLSLFLRIGGFGIVLLVALIVARDLVNGLIVISLFYIVNLFANTLLALINKKWIMVLGFILFLCCDLLIGLYEIKTMNLVSLDSFWFRIFDLPINIFWVFYLPSQVILSSSILFLKEKA